MYPGPHSQDVTLVAPADAVVVPEGHARHNGSEPPPPCVGGGAHGMGGGGLPLLLLCTCNRGSATFKKGVDVGIGRIGATVEQGGGE